MSSGFLSSPIWGLILAGIWLLFPLIALLAGGLALRSGLRGAGLLLLFGGLLSLLSSGFWFLFQLNQMISPQLFSEFGQEHFGILMDVSTGVSALGRLLEGMGLLLVILAWRSASRRATSLETVAG